MSTADKPSWIASTLRASSDHGAALVHAKADWSAADEITVALRFEQGTNRFEKEESWKVSQEQADAAQAALAKLLSKRGGPKNGPVELTLDTGPNASPDPLESVARDAVAGASHLHYSQALAAQAWAQELAAAGQASEAMAATRLGISVLGDRYSSPELIDDTQMKLTASSGAEKNGRTSEAQALLNGVLRSRLGAYQKLKNPTPAQ